jgi:hypothetical protein
MPLVVVYVTPSLLAMPVMMRDCTVSAFVEDGKGWGFAPEQGNLVWI